MSIGIRPGSGSTGIISGAVDTVGRTVGEIPVVGGLAKGLLGMFGGIAKIFGG